MTRRRKRAPRQALSPRALSARSQPAPSSGGSAATGGLYIISLCKAERSEAKQRADQGKVG
ncbi:MAG: hypothetical protein AUK47_22665 [Deltaproteobacteria bacterium CG2_30_63_29]|nr:MAG: hypothetical protein AUK47_22665 [Deltaproteobacteria bacterium CG2_30_63_29]PJB35218.1 MAG: hypothetical protein CO108_26260 [Deltaproteobacteria bacterium CG_4_9_14_3_um_filter_63_12]